MQIGIEFDINFELKNMKVYENFLDTFCPLKPKSNPITAIFRIRFICYF